MRNREILNHIQYIIYFGRIEEALKSMNVPDKYTVFNVVDRWDTLDKVVKYVDFSM